jgi:hypothetical protein
LLTIVAIFCLLMRPALDGNPGLAGLLAKRCLLDDVVEGAVELFQKRLVADGDKVDAWRFPSDKEDGDLATLSCDWQAFRKQPWW